MDVPDFRAVTVEALVGMVRGRTLTAAAVTAHALDRIDALNPGLGAFVAVDADGARTQAEAIDRRLDAGEDPGPLVGVPIGVKDLTDAAGLPTTRGAMHLRDAPSARADAVEVARLRAAGCVVVGKTNTAEFGCSDDTFNPLFGATLNPWNLAYSPGGSSGGTAAAVAAGMVPVGTGSDAGGSIRTPSAACALSGMKTSQGRVPAGPPPLGLLDLCCVGPMARRIRDVALCLDSVVGPHAGDLRSLPAPARAWRPALDSPRVPARVLWAPSFDGGPVDSEVTAACVARGGAIGRGRRRGGRGGIRGGRGHGAPGGALLRRRPGAHARAAAWNRPLAPSHGNAHRDPRSPLRDCHRVFAV